MLTKGFKDEEQKKLGQVLNAGLQMEFVPDLWKTEQRLSMDEILENTLGKNLSAIEQLPKEKWRELLNSSKLSFANAEKVGDLLLKIAPREPENTQGDLAQKALTIYEHAQQNSKTFSYGLIQKINKAKSNL